MATYNVNDLITRTRQKADMLNTDFVTDPEIVTYINEAYNRYYNTLVCTYENYYSSTSSIVLVPGTADYALPVDCLKPLGFDLNTNGNIITLKPWQITNRNKAQYSTSNLPEFYMLLGDDVRFLGTPQTSDTITCYYTPQPTLLALAGTVKLLGGADEYVVLGAAISCLQKEESDVSVLEMKANQKLNDIISLLQGRNSDLPLKVTDVQFLNPHPWFTGII